MIHCYLLLPRAALILLVSSVCWSMPAHAERLAFINARIYPVSDAPIERGVVLVENGTITAVGAMGAIQPPDKVRLVDLAGKVIIPGIVDTHSHIGIAALPAVPANNDSNEATAGIEP